jgi:hypothetical protein
VLFRTATEWVALLADAQRHGHLDAELDKLQRVPLLIVDLCRHRDYAEPVRSHLGEAPANQLLPGARAGQMSA